MNGLCDDADSDVVLISPPKTALPRPDRFELLSPPASSGPRTGWAGGKKATVGSRPGEDRKRSVSYQHHEGGRRSRKQSMGTSGIFSDEPSGRNAGAAELLSQRIEEGFLSRQSPSISAAQIARDPTQVRPQDTVAGDANRELVGRSQETSDQRRDRRVRDEIDSEKRSKGEANAQHALGFTASERPTAHINAKQSRPAIPPRSSSTPPVSRRKFSVSKPLPLQELSSSHTNSKRPVLPPLSLKTLGLDADLAAAKSRILPDGLPTPATEVPIPAFSLPLFLQLELAADSPSLRYVRRTPAIGHQYESAAITFERLQNFVQLPLQLEQALWFGTLACLDAWLYIFTILPLRFFAAVWVLVGWWARNLWNELCDLVDFVYRGCGRLWERRRQGAKSTPKKVSKQKGKPTPEPIQQHADRVPTAAAPSESAAKRRGRKVFQKHRRSRSTPSLLKSSHKADLLRGLLLVLTCGFLMSLDPSRMYHGIRGQAAIKLYVIYNVLEVADRMLGAIGQDILECLFSQECLDRGSDGRSKVMRPFWMFLSALIYTVIHSSALFYQTICLNVAVNSYSNALLTLLMSNQFVEIKGSVFKKIEKENLFQMTCADIVERFQLWMMLLIIAMRNFVELGGLGISLSGSHSPLHSSQPNAHQSGAPILSGSVLPKAFTMLPNWIGQVFGAFFIVLGSEMLVDWCKHAFITKFNNIKPNVYGRFYDLLAKDYYTHAFADQDLTKRLGLPTLPLACLFVRASIQTYQMLLENRKSLPLPSNVTSVPSDSSSATITPATTAALRHVNEVFRRALGWSTAGASSSGDGSWRLTSWTFDDLITVSTMLIVFLISYLILLVAKLFLGMFLLSFARRRYRGIKSREHLSTDVEGKHAGGWGVVEVDDEKSRWIYRDDEKGLERIKDRKEKAIKEQKKGLSIERLEGVKRYDMIAKRIW